MKAPVWLMSLLSLLTTGSIATLLPAVVKADTINYEMVTVGDAGNADDSTAFGSLGGVSYEYQIGKYEVTIGQYAMFLNAVAQTDSYSLYDTRMATAQRIAGISRSGASGSYTYSVIGPFGSVQIARATAANRPITYVNWFSAARFANWMTNGQGNGSTETGAYTLVGGQTSGVAPGRNPGAAFTLPTQDEWYKAGYYQPSSKGGPSDGYWTYATRSDSAPGNTISAGANQANYKSGGSYAVTQSPTVDSAQNYLTDVGAFSGSSSYYGTFDQAGNVSEWNDLDETPGTARGLWGGDYDSSVVGPLVGQTLDPSLKSRYQGFRLAGPANASPVPEIDPAGYGSVMALVSGAMAMFERRRIGRVCSRRT